MLKLIQLGLTFTDAEGNLPTCNGELSVWQFNFKCAGFEECFGLDEYAPSLPQALPNPASATSASTTTHDSCTECSTRPYV